MDMGFKSTIIRPYAKYVARSIDRWAGEAVAAQQQVFRELMQGLAQTAFGRDHGITADTTYEAFRQRVPLRDYEGLRDYVDRIKAGERDVLWPGRPAYFAKTSGTTSGVKYIPLTRDSIPNSVFLPKPFSLSELTATVQGQLH